MHRVLSLFAVCVLSVVPSAVSAQAQQSGKARSARDTMPEQVIQRTIDAYKRLDFDAAYASYDTVITHEWLGDKAGAQRMRREQFITMAKTDTALVRIMKSGGKFVELRRDVVGAYVNVVWAFRFPDGTMLKHLDLWEVRNGKIVREIES